jgi:hypothetical protein
MANVPAGSLQERYGMKIVRIHAVYKERPVCLIVETDNGEVLDLSLTDLSEAEDTFEERAWKQLDRRLQGLLSQLPLGAGTRIYKP